jgi:hypothetical protein
MFVVVAVGSLLIDRVREDNLTYMESHPRA